MIVSRYLCETYIYIYMHELMKILEDSREEILPLFPLSLSPAKSPYLSYRISRNYLVVNR